MIGRRHNNLNNQGKNYKVKKNIGDGFTTQKIEKDLG